MGSFLMERILRSTPNGVLKAHTEWLPGVQLRPLVPLAQYILKIARAGGCLAVVAQWQSTAAQTRGILGSTPSDCQLFHSPLVSLYII